MQHLLPAGTNHDRVCPVVQAYERGQQVHSVALPSLAEKMYQQFKDKKANLQTKKTDGILDKYGNAGTGRMIWNGPCWRQVETSSMGAQPNACACNAPASLLHHEADHCCGSLLGTPRQSTTGEKPPEDALLLGQTEAYIEYDRTGRLIKGNEVKRPREEGGFSMPALGVCVAAILTTASSASVGRLDPPPPLSVVCRPRCAAATRRMSSSATTPACGAAGGVTASGVTPAATQPSRTATALAAPARRQLLRQLSRWWPTWLPRLHRCVGTPPACACAVVTVTELQCLGEEDAAAEGVRFALHTVCAFAQRLSLQLHSTAG
jgi:hypothetical protein